MKCSRCGNEISDDESFSYQGNTFCEDCYMEVGLHPKGCDPWATYAATHVPGSSATEEKLTDLEKKIHEFIKGKGKVPRDEVMSNFKLSEADMDAQMTALFHSELVKEVRQGSKVYLISIN